MQKSIPMLTVLWIVYLAVTTAENPRFRRLHDDKEITKSKTDNFREKVGVPLVVNSEKKSSLRTGTVGMHKHEEDKEQLMEQSGKGMPDDDDDPSSGTSDDDEDSNGNGSGKKQANNGTSMEEMGSGYDNIDDMGSSEDDNNTADSANDESMASQPNDDKDLMGKDDNGSGSPGSGDSNDAPDLSGEFPPTADQVSKLPKDKELTLEEADRKLADKRKGYLQFTIRQQFKPEYKYKESPAYKILAGNVIFDVERALRAREVVKDVLFREAKNVGGPPYRSKVQVYVKLQDIKPNRLKKIIDQGLINGMIAIPGSFRAS